PRPLPGWARAGDAQEDPAALWRHAPPGCDRPGDARLARPARIGRTDRGTRPRATVALPGAVELAGRAGHGAVVHPPDRRRRRSLPTGGRPPRWSRALRR